MGEPLPDPKIAISPISADGSVGLEFNQDMVAPDTLDPTLYRKIFAMDIASGLDGTKIKGGFGQQKKGEARRRMLAEQGLDESDGAAALSFRLEVTEHTSRGVKLRTVFDNPSAVSALAEDQFNFEVKELSLFKSASNLKPLDKSAFGEGDGTIKKISPPMISDEEEAQDISSTTDSGGTALSAMSSSNFFVSLILGGSMQELWGMIRSLQMIILSVLV